MQFVMRCLIQLFIKDPNKEHTCMDLKQLKYNSSYPIINSCSVCICMYARVLISKCSHTDKAYYENMNDIIDQHYD